MTRLTFDFDATLFDDVRRDVAEIIDDALLDLGVELEQSSPVGVSPGGESLSGSWDIMPATLSADTIKASVFNPLPFSLERLAGRGPGKRPPISAVEAWARSKGISPYAVAKKIGEKGTDRWNEGASANILEADPKTKIIPTDKGPQGEATEKILRRIEGLRY